MPDFSIYSTGILFGIGICLGITIATMIFFRLIIIHKYFTSQILIYVLAFVDVLYYFLKLIQLNGIGKTQLSCTLEEDFSVILYFISLNLLYIIYIYRYKEIYGFNPRLYVMFSLVILLIISVPISIVYNVAMFDKNQSCSIYHPLISVWLPFGISILLSFFNILFFIEPLFKQSKITFIGNENNQMKSTVRVLFLSNFSAMVFNFFFLLSLGIGVLSTYAPLLSSIDLCFTFTMLVFPCFFVRLKKINNSIV